MNVTLNSVVFRSAGQDLTTAGTHIEMEDQHHASGRLSHSPQHIQYWPYLRNGFLAQTGLALNPAPP